MISRFQLCRRAVRVAAIVLLLAASLAPSAQADHPTRYEVRTSPGGFRFHHRFDPLTPYAAVTFGWSIVSEQKAQDGLRPMLGSLLVNGVYPEQPTEFYEKLADLYATASIGISDNQFVGETKAPVKELAEALELTVRAVRRGMPNVKTFRRTRNSFINGEKQSEKNPQAQVSRTASSYLLGNDHPITRGFDPKRYEAIKLADISTWRRGAFEEGPLELVVSGRISVEDAGRIIDQTFAGWPRPPKRERPKPTLVAAKPATIAVGTNGKQTIVNLFAPTAKIEGRELLTAQVANGILGAGPASRLFNAVRGALGSTYGASSSLTAISPDQRVISLNANVDPSQAAASIAALRSAYATWYDRGVTDAELKTQRERMVTGVASAYRDPAGANRLILPLLLTSRSLDDINDYEGRINALTIDSVNAFIKSRFPKPDDLTLVVGKPEGGSFEAPCSIATWREVERACASAKKP